MLKIDHVLGSRSDSEFAEKLHALEHRGAVDVVMIFSEDLARRRFLTKTQASVELAISLPRNEKLFDGAVLFFDERQAIVVRAATERWLCLRPTSLADAIELGYHAGNLHWRVRFDGRALLVALNGRVEDYVARIEPLISAGRVSFSIIENDNGDRSDSGGLGHRRHHHHHDIEDH